MTITTKQGDQGISYWLNKAVPKDDLLLEAIGTIDELQSALGIAKSEIEYGFLKNEIEMIQKDLWLIAGSLAGYETAKKGSIDLGKRVKEMEVEIDAWERELPVIRDFALPGENKKEALIQLCRSMSRRVERRVVALGKREKVDQKILPYLNRLSDFLFILAYQIAK